ncbi:hypothetical protein B0H12DRAFT_1139051, partial [Mycena haematopus]
MLNLANQTALALSLVCREWHIWSMQFLFETVHLSRYGSQKLHKCLQGTVGGVSRGNRTRRLELSVIKREDPDNSVLPADIFRVCPNIEVLVKCEDDLLRHSMQGVDLTRLKRFDWYHPWYRYEDHQFATQEDDPSHGQDFLREVVKNAPNLQYLSLIKRFRGGALITLHIELISLDVCNEIATWSFPQLRVLRIDSAFLRYSRILSVLQLCPNVTELNYSIEYDQAASPDSTVGALIQ